MDKTILLLGIVKHRLLFMVLREAWKDGHNFPLELDPTDWGRLPRHGTPNFKSPREYSLGII